MGYVVDARVAGHVRHSSGPGGVLLRVISLWSVRQPYRMLGSITKQGALTPVLPPRPGGSVIMCPGGGGMNIAILGAGGVGGYFGGILARAGNRVALLARGDHLAALRERGLE